MKKIIILVSALALLTACNQSANTNQEPINESVEATTNDSFIPLTDLQSKGSEFIDKEIQTQGIVDHVCKHGGKKILLVGDGVDVHVFSEDRFDEGLVGKEIVVTGIVKEDRTDEASLLKIEEDAINMHSEGEEDETRQERMIAYVNMMRDSLKNTGKDHFSEYYLDYVSHKEVK